MVASFRPWAFFPALTQKVSSAWYLLRLHVGVWLYGAHWEPEGRGCKTLMIQLDRWTIAKLSPPNPRFGSFMAHNEAASLRFVRKHTQIPVPKLWASFAFAGSKYLNLPPGHVLVMQRMPGVRLDYAYRLMPAEQRATVDRHLTADLKTIVQALRSIPVPLKSSLLPTQDPCYLANCESGPLFGHPFPRPFGPIDNSDDFRKYLLWNCEDGERLVIYPPFEREDVAIMERLCAALEYPIRSAFTHNELMPRNILIGSDGHVTALLDWETAGFWPDWWEQWHSRLSGYGIQQKFGLPWPSIVDEIMPDKHASLEPFGQLFSYYLIGG